MKAPADDPVFRTVNYPDRQRGVLDAPLSRGMTSAFSARFRGESSDFCDFRHQIGQALGGVQPAHAAGADGHGGEPGGFGGQR